MRSWHRVAGLLLFFTLLFGGCSDPFSYTPFEVDVAEIFKNTNAKNLEKIRNLDDRSDKPFTVALISDPHYHYDDLADAIEAVNKDDEYSFILVAGDLTENGLQKEYELFHQVMSKANIPYVALIGNHDYLSNGSKVYEQMYGDFNFTFAFHHVKFVAWDNTVWESKKKMDLEWLSNALETTSDTEGIGHINHVIPVSHIPPFDQQFTETRDEFHQILKGHNIKFSIHGHRHDYFFGHIMDEAVDYLTIGSPSKRYYVKLVVTATELNVEQVEF